MGIPEIHSHVGVSVDNHKCVFQTRTLREKTLLHVHSFDYSARKAVRLRGRNAPPGKQGGF